MKRKFLTTDYVRTQKASGAKEINLAVDEVLTPLAFDLCRDFGISVIYPASVAPEAPKPLVAGNQSADVPDLESVVRQVVSAVVVNMTAGSVQPVTPVTRVGAGTAEMIPFPFEINRPEMDVKIVDVITASHNSPIGAGFLSFHKGSFPWTLTYDEIEYVIKGEIHIGTAQGTVVGKPGDVLYIPKGTQITFGTPEWAKILYVTYPADWSP